MIEIAVISIAVILISALIYFVLKYARTDEKLKTNKSANDKLRETDEEIKKHTGFGNAIWKHILHKDKSD